MIIDEKDPKPYQHLPNFSSLKYPNGSVYNGQVFEGKRHGKGRFFSNVLDFCDGEWVNDKLNGKGICQLPNGDRFEGDFQNGEFHGNGKLFYSNKSWYKGEFQNGVKHGQGIETYPSGMVYTGQFVKDKANGKGVQVKGDYSYEGDFQDGMKEGQGKESFKESKYEGSFWRGQKHGKGVWTHNDGSYYKGDWHLGQKHGYGIDHKVDTKEIGVKKEETYEGEFYEGYREGFGRLTQDNTGNYSYGFWHRGVRTGQFLFFNNELKEYSLHVFDFGKEEGEPRFITQPLPEQDGFRSLIEDSVIKGEKVHDVDFNPSEILKGMQQLWNIDGDTLEWARASELFNSQTIQFFSMEERGKIELSKYSNYQLLTVLLMLTEYPSQLLKFFSPQYSADLGYYILKFFIAGEWKQILIDDLFPLFKEKVPLSSRIGAKQNVGFHLIEKAWAKLTGGYFSCYSNPLSPEGVIEALTGVSPQFLSFSAAEKNNSWEALISEKNKAYKLKFAVPSQEFALSMGLPPGYFYTVLDYVPGDNFDLVRLRSVDKTKVLESKWNDLSTWHPRLLKRLQIAGVEETLEEGTFWIEADKFLELFEYALICPLQEGFRHLSFLRKGNYDQMGATRHEMRFFEFEVPYKTLLTLVVTQLIDAKDTHFPMRLILTKKLDSLQLEYIFGKGQFNLMSMSRTLVLDSGTYDLCVHIEYPKEIPLKQPMDLSVVLHTPAPIKLKPEQTPLAQFLNKAYSSCAKKQGERTDLSKFPNGSDKLVFYELFKAEDGVFVQHFVNNTDKVRWKYSANFTLTNMKIVGLPEHKQQVEITVEPKRTHTLLIMQTGGKSYEFLGGQGSVNLEVIERSTFKAM